jgi:hypothetical protein
MRLAAPQQRADARNQLLGRERLGDVVVRARLEAGDLVELFGARGEEDDRQLARARIARRPARQRSPDWPGSIQSSSTRSGSMSEQRGAPRRSSRAAFRSPRAPG